jgi:hypothetical protein
VGTGEGVDVGVTDGVNVDVTVTLWMNEPVLVGDKCGEAVAVVRGAASTEAPPQEVNNKAAPNNRTNNFFINQ